MRILPIFLVLMVLVGFSLFLQSTVTAQISYVTVYGQLDYYQCTTTGSPLVPCQNYFYLATNGTTPGIPSYPMLDFSQSIFPAPAKTDAGRIIAAMGYYGQESQCPMANGCFAFFVHTWGPYYGLVAQFTPPASTGCFTSSNPPTTWSSVPCVAAPTMPLRNSSLPLGTPVPFNVGVFLSNPSNLIIIALAIALVYLVLRTRKKWVATPRRP